MARFSIALVLSLALSGCRCGSSSFTETCKVTADCPAGETCVGEICQRGTGDGGPGTDGGRGDGGVISLAFVPPSATLVIDGSGPQSASFTLEARFGNGTAVPVPPQSIQFDRPDLAVLSGSNPFTLTASGPYAGVGHLQAVYGGHAAQATLTVQVRVVDIGPGVTPAQIAGLDAGSLAADPSVTSILYPYDGTYFPLGLTSPLAMWNAPNPTDVYRLHLEEQNYTFDGYYVVAPPAQQRVAQATWDAITASNGGDPLQFVLSRWDVASSTAYQSASESWTIVPASLRGAIYYWTTSGTGHMSRIYPGTGAAPQVLNGGTCQGCHAVSADGSTLVTAIEGQAAIDNPGDSRAWSSFDLPAVTLRKASNLFAGNVAVNPDGKYTVAGTVPLKLEDATLGTLIPDAGLDTVVLEPGMATLAHPAFSPDGKELATVESNGNWYLWTLGALGVFDFDEATTTFSHFRVLTDSSAFNVGEQAIAYPSFSPDSQWIAFHVGDYASGCNNACSAATADTGNLYLEPLAGGTPIRLATLTDSSVAPAEQNHAFEPTFNPIARGDHFWLVFTTTRSWGNRISGPPVNGQKRLWVAALEESLDGGDPSHPPFFLEGQEETTMNMRGFWALAACIPTDGGAPSADAGADGGTCSAGFECCSGFCEGGACVDVNQVACKPVGEFCVTAADCCNQGSVYCIAGLCSLPQ